MERVEKDVLDGQRPLVVAVELAAALGVTDVDPVCGPVAGSLESLSFHEGFEQNRAVAVALLPVLAQPSDCRPKDAGGEVVGSNPGEDQETCVVDDPVEAEQALVLGPADELVAWRHGPRRGSKAQGQATRWN